MRRPFLVLVLLAACLAGPASVGAIDVDRSGLMKGIENSGGRIEGLRKAREAERRRAEEYSRSKEGVEKQNRLNCFAIEDYALREACLGNCAALSASYPMRQMCEGNCVAAPSAALRMACEGQCGGISDAGASVRCHQCAEAGAAVKWATLYAGGYVMSCFKR